MTDVSVPHKCCTKCGNEYPATREYFTTAKSSKDGLYSYCKSCCREYMKQHRERHPEKAKTTAHRHYVKYKDEHLEYSRQQYAANRETLCSKQRKRYARTAEDQREKARARCARNRVRNRVVKLRREAIKRSVLFNFTIEHQRRALEYFHGCCAVCKRPLNDLFGTHHLEWDHWIPLVKHGNTTPDNMLPLCGGRGGCNTRKSKSDPKRWVTRNFRPSQAKQILARVEAYFEWIKAQDFVEYKR